MKISSVNFADLYALCVTTRSGETATVTFLRPHIKRGSQIVAEFIQLGRTPPIHRP